MIELENLTLSYPDKIIFNKVQFEFPPASNIAVMGPSGCGKTTLLKALGGLLKPLEGEIKGITAKKSAFVFQEDRLLPWRTALQNVALAGDGNMAKARLWLERLKIYETDKYPDALSGGMARRVALARAMCYQGDLLLMDEPFRGLDNETRDSVSKSILEEKLPIIFTTHDREEAELMDAVIVRVEDMNQ